MTVLIVSKSDPIHDDLELVGSPEDLEALGHLIIAKAKMGKNLSATYVSKKCEGYSQKIHVLSDDEYYARHWPNGFAEGYVE
jgi:hypothetical protein